MSKPVSPIVQAISRSPSYAKSLAKASIRKAEELGFFAETRAPADPSEKTEPAIKVSGSVLGLKCKEQSSVATMSTTALGS